MVARELKASILPGLLSGARAGAGGTTINVSDPLQALSLTGQALRFDRPPQPAAFQAEEKVIDERPIVSHDIRILLLRLVYGKNSTSLLAAAVARALSAANLRLYPFHMSMLDMFVQAHAEILGPEALAFSQRETPFEQKQSYFAPDKLSDETWMLATPAIKARYIMERRVVDPVAARVLVEAVWGAENADSRLRLLGTFREHLSDADAPFLSGLAKDRAPRVRELAQKLLARLPGFEGDNPALRAVLERIKVGKSGLVFKKPALSLELPTTVQKPAAAAWVRENFTNVGMVELARALSIYPHDMIEAAHNDAFMTFACFIMVTEEKRFDMAETILARHMGDVWDGIIASGLHELPAYTRAERLRWVDIAVQPRMWTADTSLWSLSRLVELLEGPASDTLFQRILGSKPWVASLKDPTRLSPEIIDGLAMLCPPAMRALLRAQLTDIDAAKTSSAILFLELMDILEATHA